MIGQSVINVQAGGRTRVAGITCGLAILAYVTFGASVIEKIPIAALVGTMLCLVVDIFEWSSFSRASKIPKTDAAVIALVTCVTVVTNLAVAVFAGVVVSALGFAWKSAKRVDAERRVERDPLDTADVAVYALRGPLFFGSARAFAEAVDALGARETAKRVVLDFATRRSGTAARWSPSTTRRPESSAAAKSPSHCAGSRPTARRSYEKRRTWWR